MRMEGCADAEGGGGSERSWLPKKGIGVAKALG